MNQVITFEDGHIEYWSTFSHTNGLSVFNSQKKALAHIDTANGYFPSGVRFHKELNGMSILPSDCS
jgi:hypothetical protein